MINVTAQYPAQSFLPPAVSNIETQVNGINSSSVPSVPFPRTYSRVSAVGTAPDGSNAVMYQIDAMINQSARYSYSSINEAQSRVQEAAAYKGNEYYIELRPLSQTYYSILTWASNL